jgi:DNA-binding YbaB/EbfC family protein
MSESFDFKNIIAQAQEMSGKLKQVQEQLRHRTVEATVGGGMVEATVNGQLELVSVRIDPQAVDPRDVDMLQDLIVAAVNQAMVRAKEMAQSEMQSATGIPIAQLMGQLGGSS